MDPVKPESPFDKMEDRILPWSQVKVISGLSRTTVWRMQKAGDFPACVQVSSNRVGWWQSELLAWARARMPRRPSSPRSLSVPDKPLATAPVVSEAPKTSTAKIVKEKEGPPANKSRKRKSAVPDTQKAFDFGP